MTFRQIVFVIAASVLLLLSACSSLPTDDSSRVVALTGVVTGRRDADGTKGSGGGYRPGQGGAIGGLVAGVIIGMNTTGPFHIYSIRKSDGSEREVAAYYEVADGSCVDVAVPADRNNFDEHWKPSEVVFRASTACAK